MWALTTTLRVELRRAKCGDCFAMCTDVMPVASLTAAPAPRPRPRVEGPRGVVSRLPNVRHYILVFLHCPGLPRRTLYCAPAVHGCRYGPTLRVDHRRASSSGRLRTIGVVGDIRLDVKRRQREPGHMKASIVRAAVGAT